jgi:hypothetical protein
VDSTFYGCPTIEAVRNWALKTPPGFIFSLKIPRTIPHEKVLVDCGKEFEQFVTTVDVLDENLGPMVFQFPFFESHQQAAAQPTDELQNRGRFRFQDGLQDQLAGGIHDRNRDRCLMNIHANILCLVHNGALSVGADARDQNPPQSGRLLYCVGRGFPNTYFTFLEEPTEENFRLGSLAHIPNIENGGSVVYCGEDEAIAIPAERDAEC